MIKFSKDWLYDKVTVSRFPELADIQAGEFDSFKFRINVSDIYKPEVDDAFLRRGIQNNWFPLGEAFGMALESIYGALRVLHEAERQNSAQYCCIATQDGTAVFSLPIAITSFPQ